MGFRIAAHDQRMNELDRLSRTGRLASVAPWPEPHRGKGRFRWTEAGEAARVRFVAGVGNMHHVPVLSAITDAGRPISGAADLRALVCCSQVVSCTEIASEPKLDAILHFIGASWNRGGVQAGGMMGG